MMNDDDEGDLMCAECGVRFSSRGQLVRHLMSLPTSGRVDQVAAVQPVPKVSLARWVSTCSSDSSAGNWDWNSSSESEDAEECETIKPTSRKRARLESESSTVTQDGFETFVLPDNFVDVDGVMRGRLGAPIETCAGKTLLKCPHCKAMRRSLSLINYHLTIHATTGKRVVECRICGIHSRQSNIMQHMRRFHRDKLQS